MSRVKQRKLIDALQGGAVLKYLKKLDFSKESPLTELYTIEVHEQRFRRVQERSIQATEEEQKEPLEGDKRGNVLTHRDEAKEKVSPEKERPNSSSSRPTRDRIITSLFSLNRDT